MRASVLKKLMEIQDEDLRRILIEVVEEIEKDIATRGMLEEFLKRTDENFARVWEVLREVVEAQKRSEAAIQDLRGAVQELRGAVQELAEAQKRNEAEIRELRGAVQELAEAQKRNEAEIRELREVMLKLAEAQRRMTEVLEDLAKWRRGEEGRREGEKYEWHIIGSARRLLGWGRSGSPRMHPSVAEQLDAWLAGKVDITETVEDPYLADVLWWSDGKILVVEVSLAVNGWDVERAYRRAALLRKAGLDATGVVIGKTWATWEAKDYAQEKGVEWYVEGEFSPGLLEIRRKYGKREKLPRD